MNFEDSLVNFIKEDSAKRIVEHILQYGRELELSSGELLTIDPRDNGYDVRVDDSDNWWMDYQYSPFKPAKLEVTKQEIFLFIISKMQEQDSIIGYKNTSEIRLAIGFKEDLDIHRTVLSRDETEIRLGV